MAGADTVGAVRAALRRTGMMALCLATAMPLAAFPARGADDARVPGGAEQGDPAPGRDAGTGPMLGGRLLGTTGVSQVEGAGGGGLVPWALVTGHATRDSVGANVHGTVVRLGRYTLYSPGVAVGLYDRVELSYARQWFDTRSTGRALGLGAGYTFHQDVLGAKVRLFGDAVYDQDRWWPQVAVGAQFKQNDRGDVLRAVGARSSRGVDIYVSATKLFLAESVLVDATVRLTKANQIGLLGFGGDRDNAYRPQLEVSAAYLLTRSLAVGGEYRMKPSNLSFSRESDWWDVFAAWFVSKNLSVTLAYANLGTIATRKGQDGVYLSLQAGF